MEENKNAYSEVIEILKLIDDEEKLEKMPMEMLEVLKSKVNPEYKPVISMDIPLEEQNLQPETFAILSWIATKYWNENPEVIEENVEKVDNGVMEENAKIQDAIENREETVDNVETVETVEKDESITNDAPNTLLPIVHSDLKWYERIKMKIIEFFNKLLKKRKINEERGNA